MPPPLLALTAAHARELLGRLCACGAAWIEVLRGAPPPPSLPIIPVHPAGQTATLLRVLRAMRWASMLAALLAGRLQLPALRARKPLDNGDHEDLRDRDPGDPQHSLAGADRAMFHAFRTRPVGKIVARICRDLGVSKTHEFWPADLIAITHTPAEWTAAQAQQAPPAPAATVETTPPSHPNQTTHPSTQTDPPPPDRPP